MTNTIVSSNTSFANHGGGELYDRGSQATFDNCTFEGNTTWYDMPEVTNPPIGRNMNTDYKFEGYGGAIMADQPLSLVFKTNASLSITKLTAAVRSIIILHPPIPLLKR